MTSSNSISSIFTPAFLVDTTIAKKNALDMINKSKQMRVKLRPHIKTHKSLEIAEFQVDESRAITVSTAAEVIFFYRNGFHDICFAVPITLEKLKHIQSEIPIDTIHFLTDHLSEIKKIESFLDSKGLKTNCYIKIDSGANRAGVQPKSNELLDLGIFLSRSNSLNFTGLLTHAGHSYQYSNAEKKKAVLNQEINSILNSALFLEEQNIEVKERSIGSTPTMSSATRLEGITEIRPGNYVLFDVFQLNRGNCKPTDIACKVLTSIIGIYPERERILIDAGALALSKDPGYWKDEDIQFGLFEEYPDLKLIKLSQEHGIVHCPKSHIETFSIGQKLTVFPNHSCLTSACYESYYLINSHGNTQTTKPVKYW